jgi:hypothetical protein
MVKGRREGFNVAPTFSEKVTKSDLKRLRESLDDKSPLVDVLDECDCEPFDYDDYCKNLPSKIKLENKKKTLLHLNTENVRTDILKQLDNTFDPFDVLYPEEIAVVKNKVNGSVDESLEIERNTRGQADCPEWFQHRQIRLTASNFGGVMNRRDNISQNTSRKN